MIKKWTLGLLMGSVLLASMPEDVLAKRVGGGGSAGMKRSVPTQPMQRDATPHNNATPAQQPGQPTQAQGATAGAAAQAAQPRRSWMGPIAGLAAGLGLAALMSHFGMGEAFANMIMMALLAVAAVALITFLMRRFGKGAQRGATAPFAFAGGVHGGAAGGTAGGATGSAPQPFERAWPQTPDNVVHNATPASSSAAHVPVAFDTTLQGNVQGNGPRTLPADFDQPGFERLAKMIFIRLQAANDAADLNDLRTFTTPELFAALRLDLQDRGAQPQVTDVVEVNADVLDLAEEAERQIISVRYHGRIRETVGGPAEPFDEIWHMVKPRGDAGQWAIAGIQQNAATGVH